MFAGGFKDHLRLLPLKIRRGNMSGVLCISSGRQCRADFTPHTLLPIPLILMLYFVSYLTKKSRILEMDGVPIVKFGYTNSIERRMESYQYGLPNDLILFATSPGDRKDEQTIIQMMDGFRVEGEWFEYEGVRYIIDSLNQTPVVYRRRGRRDNPSVTDSFLDWVRNIRPGHTRNIKDFHRKMNTPKNQILSFNSTLTPPKDGEVPRKIIRELESMGVSVDRRQGKGTTLTRL